jgi:hypothetical protein
MKTFRLISAALLAVLMCANFVSCSKDDDGANTDVGGNDEGGNQEVTVSEKKLVKMVSNEETYTFSYDNEGRLSSATEIDDDGDKYSYKFVWGDDAVVVKYEYEDGDTHTETYTLKNGLVQSWSADYHNGHHTEGTYYYNSSNRLIKAAFTHHLGFTVNAVWDKDKLVSVDTSDTYEAILTYGETCKKGYLPLISDIIGLGDVLFMVHPEIAGMRTNQLPNTYSPDDEEISMTYEYDKEGYISKIKMKNEDGDSDTYTLTWK